jgi:hypothetical protein
VLSRADVTIVPRIPRSGTRTKPATKLPTMLPHVFAAYVRPTAAPEPPTARTTSSTASGNIAPMASVGTRIVLPTSTISLRSTAPQEPPERAMISPT